MRILLVSPYFPPQNAGASRRVHAFAATWASRGHEVTVLTTVKRPDQRGLEVDCRGFDVVEVPYHVPRALDALRRSYDKDADSTTRPWAMAMLGRLRDHTGILGSARMPVLTDRWVRPAVRWALDQPPWDVVVSSAGPYTAHLVALSIKRHRRTTRWASDYRDLWVDNHLWRGLFPFTVRERLLERACLSEADRVWTVSDELADTLRARTRAAVDVVYNGYDRAELDGVSSAPAFAADGRVRLVYTGALYRPGQDPGPLLRSLAALRTARPDTALRFQLVVVGDGHDRWLRWARDLGIEDLLDARPMVDRSTALRMQRDAGALVLLDWVVPDAGVLTGKLFDYLGATAPILHIGGSAESSMGRILTRSRRGVSLGTDERSIGETLVALVETPAQVRAEPDRAYVDGFDRRCQSLRALEMITRSPEPSGGT